YSDIPANVIELGKKSILDGLGLALAGSVVESGDLSRKYITALGPQGGSSTVIGSAMKASPRFAAFANGVGIHSEDYDDTQLATGPGRVYGMLTHPTAPVLPAALALGEAKGISGRDLLLAYNLGVEVETKICQAVNPRLYLGGFHSTGTVGTFGAATAAAKLHGLDAHWVTDAYGIAGAEASGLQASLGTMTKPFQAGHASASGVEAAALASIGWTASLKVLEDPGGFFHAFGGGYDPGYIVGKLGSPWTFASPGVSIKPFPCGSLAHPGMDKFLSMVQENHVHADQVEGVIVGVNHAVPKALFYHDPHTALQAKFSMEFCIASLLLYGKAGLRQFQNDVVNRPEVQSAIKRVQLVVDPRADAAGYNKMRTYITIKLRDGRTLTGFADFAKGSPAHPMSYDEVAQKFRGCTDFAKWPTHKAEAIIEAVRGLENIPNVTKLTALLAT
ncbi:MAG: MmgE/PrpD family protein, partial [Terriglobia bacterium]